MSPPIQFRRGPLQDAADAYSSARDQLAAATDKLAAQLASSSGAAGSDDPGKTFSAQIDPAQRTAAEGATAVILATGNVHDLLQQTAFNYAAANHIDPAKAQTDKAVPDWISPLYYVPPTPSLFGGPIKDPGWWSKLKGYIGGKIWPNADSGKLSALGSAWTNAATSFRNVADGLASTNSILGEQQIPEAGQITSNTSKLMAAIHQMADNMDAIGKAASAYADAVDSAHEQLDDQVKTLVELAVAAVAAGIFVSIASAGALSPLGAGIGGGGGGGAMAAAAARALSIIEALTGSVLESGTVARIVAGATGQKITEIQGLLNVQLDAGQYNAIDVPGDNGYDPAARRVKLRKGTKDEIKHQMAEDGLTTPSGDFIDPNTRQIIPKDGPFDYGHRPDYTWWKTQQMARDEGWTRQQIIEYENDPTHYRIEDPSSNRSNQFNDLPRR